MAKKDETVLTKKQKADLTEQILNEIDSSIKNDIVNEVIDEVKKNINIEFKNVIKDNITKEMTNEIKASILKEQNKLIRHKNFKIVRLYLYIIFLLVLGSFVLYRLYDTNNLGLINIFSEKNIINKTETNKKDNYEPITTNVKDFNTLLKEYSSLLDNIKVNNKDLFKSNNYIKDISYADRLAMSYQILSSSQISVDGLISIIENNDLQNAYTSIFGNIEYKPENFNVNGLNYAYSNNTNSFIAVGNKTESNEIFHKITNIVEEKNGVKIIAKVGIINSGILYNVNDLTNPIISTNELDESTDYLNNLSSVEYEFIKSNENYYLNRISNN